jgi:hypothetical protein
LQRVGPVFSTRPIALLDLTQERWIYVVKRSSVSTG